MKRPTPPPVLCCSPGEIARKDTEQLLNRTEKKQPKRQFVPLKEVKPGQEVVIAELDQHAVVLSRPDKNGMVEVRAGILKTKVPLTGLCAPDKMDKRTQKQEPPRTRTRVELNHDRKSSMELNLLGYTVEEALAEVDRFLDHAMLSNQNTVYIIHGNGTGALRNAHKSTCAPTAGSNPSALAAMVRARAA